MSLLKRWKCDRCGREEATPDTSGWVAYKSINHQGEAAFNWDMVTVRHMCCECADKVGPDAFPHRNSAPLSTGWKG